jgi:hypothetical protein
MKLGVDGNVGWFGGNRSARAVSITIRTMSGFGCKAVLQETEDAMSVANASSANAGRRVFQLSAVQP